MGNSRCVEGGGECDWPEVADPGVEGLCPPGNTAQFNGPAPAFEAREDLDPAAEVHGENAVGGRERVESDESDVDEIVAAARLGIGM